MCLLGKSISVNVVFIVTDKIRLMQTLATISGILVLFTAVVAVICLFNLKYRCADDKCRRVLHIILDMLLLITGRHFLTHLCIIDIFILTDLLSDYMCPLKQSLYLSKIYFMIQRVLK